jgi:hypothetical protein
MQKVDGKAKKSSFNQLILTKVGPNVAMGTFAPMLTS